MDVKGPKRGYGVGAYASVYPVLFSTQHCFVIKPSKQPGIKNTPTNKILHKYSIISYLSI